MRGYPIRVHRFWPVDFAVTPFFQDKLVWSGTDICGYELVPRNDGLLEQGWVSL